MRLWIILFTIDLHEVIARKSNRIGHIVFVYQSNREPVYENVVNNWQIKCDTITQRSHTQNSQNSGYTYDVTLAIIIIIILIIMQMENDASS